MKDGQQCSRESAYLVPGHSKRLILAMRSYNPVNVVCVVPPVTAPMPLDCQGVLNLMPADTDTHVFGRIDEPFVSVGLPKIFTARKIIQSLPYPSLSFWPTEPVQRGVAV